MEDIGHVNERVNVDEADHEVDIDILTNNSEDHGESRLSPQPPLLKRPRDIAALERTAKKAQLENGSV